MLLSERVWNRQGLSTPRLTLGTARKNSSHNLNPYFRSLWVLAETGCHQAAHDFFPPHCRTAGEDTGVAHPSVEDSQEVCTTSFSTSPPSQVGGTGSGMVVVIWYIDGPYEKKISCENLDNNLFWWWCWLFQGDILRRKGEPSYPADNTVVFIVCNLNMQDSM